MKRKIKRNILLNPGPATTIDAIKYAQVVPDICPREKEFGDLMKKISRDLTLFVADNKQYTSVLFGGSGTAAIESILSSVVRDKDCILIINNGAYGKRMLDIVKIYKLNYVEFKSSFENPIDLKKLERLIAKHKKKTTHVGVVHNETTTGLLNDVGLIGRICKKHNIEMIVDAMSSYAAVPIDMKKMNIKYLAGSANKNLQGIAGVSFVIAHKKSLERTKNIKPRNLYLNLYAQYDYFNKKNQMRFTPPVQTMYALAEAIK